MAVRSFGVSIESISLNPVRLFNLGSFIQICHVYLMSALVTGWPSDHLRFGRSSHFTSILSPFTVTPPFDTSGTDLASTGTYFPSFVVAARPSVTPYATT